MSSISYDISIPNLLERNISPDTSLGYFNDDDKARCNNGNPTLISSFEATKGCEKKYAIKSIVT